MAPALRRLACAALQPGIEAMPPSPTRGPMKPNYGFAKRQRELEKKRKKEEKAMKKGSESSDSSENPAPPAPEEQQPPPASTDQK
jgi:hypothetical protein